MLLETIYPTRFQIYPEGTPGFPDKLCDQCSSPLNLNLDDDQNSPSFIVKELCEGFRKYWAVKRTCFQCVQEHFHPTPCLKCTQILQEEDQILLLGKIHHFKHHPPSCEKPIKSARNISE